MIKSVHEVFPVYPALFCLLSGYSFPTVMPLHLDLQQPDQLGNYLERQGWIGSHEVVSLVTNPIEGNRHYTVRVVTGPADQPVRTLIVKQSQPYFERYPTLAAPADRAIVEGHFYETIGTIPMIQSHMPHLLGIDEANSILVFEDVGPAVDYLFLYEPDQRLSQSDINVLTAYLSELHYQVPHGPEGDDATTRPNPVFENRAMRMLNHEYMFDFPFQLANGFDLDALQPGLQALALPYKQDRRLIETVRQVGRVYLDDSRVHSTKVLLHGNFYPGSWLKTEQGIKIIDPEFCFYGPAEFDLGLLLAHLHLSQQPPAWQALVLENYQKPPGFDAGLLRQFTGIEIIRRLIGLAQPPLTLSLAQKQAQLELAKTLILTHA